MKETVKPQKERKVQAIKNGTVIDHIRTGYALRIARLLHLLGNTDVMSVGLNFRSKTLGRKDLIKIEDHELTPEDANRLAILAPQASISIIQNYAVIKKFKPELPKEISGLSRCPNPQCITNHENPAPRFQVSEDGDRLTLRCHYCEKLFGLEDLKF